MSIAHLAHMLGDFAEGIEESPEEVVGGLTLIGLLLGFKLPYKAVAELSGKKWQLAPEGSYDSVTFDDDVPQNLTAENPVVEFKGNLFVYGSDGDHGFYWKFEPNEHRR